MNSSKYNYVNLQIERVFAGWVDVSFSCGEDKVVISASDVYGNDGPKILLDKFIEFYQTDISQKVVMWDEEPGIYFIIFSKKNNICSLSISYSEKAEDSLSNAVRDIIDNVSKSELINLLDDWEDILVVENFSQDYLLKVLYERFFEYDPNEYQNNWMEYPYEQIEKMKEILASN